jgi:hypothetical protein
MQKLYNEDQTERLMPPLFKEEAPLLNMYVREREELP